MPFFRMSPKKNKIIKAFSLPSIPCQPGKRASLYDSIHFHGSITIEASLVVPIFLFFMMSILYIFQIIHLQSGIIQSLHQEGNKLVLEAYGNSEYMNDGYVIIERKYQIKPFLFWMNPGDLQFSHRYYGHAWIGYDVSNGTIKEDVSGSMYVYIAETGAVYHWNKDCTYLRLSVRSVDWAKLDDLRNKAGGNYYECELCGEERSDIYYLTDYGNRYHSDPVCSGLKRTIYRIRLEEALAQERTACSKCGGN